jgi:microcystin-dependent protein
MFGIPNFDLLSDRGKQEFIEYVVNLTRKEINSYTPSYNNVTASTMLTEASLPTTGTAGTYTKVTTDVYGRVASGTTLIESDIPALSPSKTTGTAITAADTGTVTSTMILDGTILNADINAAAAIAPSKINGTAIVANDTSYLNPTGSILAYGGVTVPSGYLFCDGAQVSRTTYAALYAALGANRYGVDTATLFFLPNLTSHLPRGAATTSGTVTTNNNNTHGHGNNATTVGNPTITVTNVNNATSLAHNHNNNGASTSSDGAHNHNNNGITTTGGSATNRGATGAQASVANGAHQHTVGGTSTSSTGGHNHNVNGASTSSDGGTLAHSHANTATATQGTVTTGTVIDNTTYVPAFVEVNYIIKT